MLRARASQKFVFLPELVSPVNKIFACLNLAQAPNSSYGLDINSYLGTMSYCPSVLYTTPTAKSPTTKKIYL